VDDEEEFYEEPLAKSMPIPTELELGEAEARNLVQHQVRIGVRKQFNWEDCPTWQADRPPDYREPPWRIPGQRWSGYFHINEIERFLLDGDH
jgi:hypothetical protein